MTTVPAAPPAAAAPAARSAAAGAESPKPSRLLGGDAVRAVAAIAVVCIHASVWGPRVPFDSVDRIARFSVPAFMLLTGALLAYHYTGRTLGPGFMRRRLSRSVLPWLVWAPIYVVFDIVTGTVAATTSDVGNFFAQGAGHLWFLLLIPQFYVLFAVWPARRQWTLAAVALGLQTVLCLIRLYVVLPGWVSTLVLTYASEIFPFWIGYFAIGVALGSSLGQPGRGIGHVSPGWRVALTAAATVGVAASGYLLLTLQYPGAPYAPTFLRGTGAFLNPVLPLLVLSAAGWVALTLPPIMRRSRLVLRAVTFVSEQSLGVYIVHPILVVLLSHYVLKDRLLRGDSMSIVAVAVLVLVALLGSLLAVRLVSATFLSPTLGAPRRPLSFRRGRGMEREAA